MATSSSTAPDSEDAGGRGTIQPEDGESEDLGGQCAAQTISSKLDDVKTAVVYRPLEDVAKSKEDLTKTKEHISGTEEHGAKAKDLAKTKEGSSEKLSSTLKPTSKRKTADAKISEVNSKKRKIANGDRDSTSVVEANISQSPAIDVDAGSSVKKSRKRTTNRSKNGDTSFRGQSSVMNADEQVRAEVAAAQSDKNSGGSKGTSDETKDTKRERIIKVKSVKIPKARALSIGFDEDDFADFKTETEDKKAATPVINDPVDGLSQASGNLGVIFQSDVKNGQFTDFTLTSRDSQKLGVHKAVVYHYSPYIAGIIDQYPRKSDIPLKCQKGILDGIIRYMYFGSCKIGPHFEPSWEADDDFDVIELEFHTEIHRMASALGMQGLQRLSLDKIKNQVANYEYSNAIYGKLQDAKNADDVAFPIVEAVMAMQARKVQALLAKGGTITEAFHKAAAGIKPAFLKDFIQVVGNETKTLYHLYLRCPGCNGIICARNKDTKQFTCANYACAKRGELGELRVWQI